MTPDYFIAGLVKRGMPEHIAKGFVANFMAESNLDPGINEIAPLVPGSRGGYGLYQLTGPRRRQYEAWAAENGFALDDPEAQMDFMMLELATTEKRAWDRIQGATDAVEAARLVSDAFLRPGIPRMDKRLKFASQLSGKPVTATQSGMEADGPGRIDRNPQRLAWAYANGRMTPEEEAVYERGVAEGIFLAAQKARAPEPRSVGDVYASVAMRPRVPFQPVPLNAGIIQKPTPFGRL